MSRRLKHLTSCLAVLVFLLLAAGSEDQKASTAPGNPAKGQVVDTKVAPEVFIVNGEPDVGYVVKVKVKNIGTGAGALDVRVVLRTDQGDFERSREGNFAIDETRLMTFQFSEPNMNTAEASAQVSVAP